MFQNRCPFLYNSSAFLLSFLCMRFLDFVLSWNFISRTIFTYLWPDSILLHKRKMAMETRLFILFWTISFSKENVSLHLHIFLLLIWRVHLIRSCLVWKFSWLTNKCSSFFKCYYATTFPEQVTNATKIWIWYKFNLFLTQKWEENIPKFYFCIRAPTFSTHMQCPFICSRKFALEIKLIQSAVEVIC